MNRFCFYIMPLSPVNKVVISSFKVSGSNLRINLLKMIANLYF